MDKLPPPPKGSPEEIQAWNNMMDTMVTFIKASTHLMNTITDKVRNKAKSGVNISASSPVEGCEPECEVCQPKPPCGICGKAKPTTPPPVAAPEPETPAEESANAEAPPDPPPPEDAPPEDSEPPADQTEAEAPDETPASPEAVPQPASGEGQCICSTIRAQKLAAEKKDRCSCSKKSKNLSDVSEESSAPDLEVEIMCGCGATPGNTEAMMQDMMGKLASAQEEINLLQEELAKLQRMDASKRTGPHAGPNPAALYREIMKDTGMNRGPYEPVCVPCGDDTPRTSPGSYMGSPDMTMSSRPMMRPPPMPQFGSGRSTPFYASPQPPCRRPGQRYMGQSPSQAPTQMSPMYGRSPQEYNDSPNPEYWSRLAEYSPTPNSQAQRIVCPSMRSPAPETPQPPKRTIICSPPPRPSGPSNCNSNSCRIQDPNLS